MPGVSEVNTWGGEIKQYQITADPAVLAQYGLTLNDVAQRVEENNANFGGGIIEHNGERYTLRGTGRAESTDDLGNTVLLSRAGVPVLLRDVAQVAIGAAPPHLLTLYLLPTMYEWVFQQDSSSQKAAEHIREGMSV